MSKRQKSLHFQSLLIAAPGVYFFCLPLASYQCVSWFLVVDLVYAVCLCL